MIKSRKVGGIRFISIGRVCITLSVKRRTDGANNLNRAAFASLAFCAAVWSVAFSI